MITISDVNYIFTAVEVVYRFPFSDCIILVFFACALLFGVTCYRAVPKIIKWNVICDNYSHNISVMIT